MTKWSIEDETKLEQWDAEGVPIKEQAERLGVSYGTIVSKRSRMGLGSERAPRQPKLQAQDDLPSRLWPILRRGQKSQNVFDLADALEVPPKAVMAAIEDLIDQGHAIQRQDHSVWIGTGETSQTTEAPKSLIDLDQYRGDRVIRFGLVSDNHLCSKYERLDVLNALYDLFLENGLQTVYNCGNWIDGEARFNKQDIHTHGMGNQFKYMARHYPRRDGITTYAIGGDDHEGWYTQREGIDVGRMLKSYMDAEGRTDVQYLGYMEHDVVIPAPRGQTRIRLVHPGGGTAYALSYQPQKLIESLSGGEKPEILLIGHYHKSEYLHYRNIHCWQAGCTQDQSPFMRKKRLSAHVGGWIIELWQADDGSVRRTRSEWISFFDRGYHEKEWQYKMEG